jgi:trans-feruloyl-CoA hydratase/vanillin synthase
MTDSKADAISARAEEETVAVTIENRIAWVRYNRPEKRNCMSPALNRQMLRVLEELEFREDVGVLVLGGEGTAFSAGMDLQEYFRDNEKKGIGAIRKSQREAYGWWDRLRWYEKPTIGMVMAGAFGGAYGPLHALDIVVAADEASLACRKSTGAFCPAAAPARWRRN